MTDPNDLIDSSISETIDEVFQKHSITGKRILKLLNDLSRDSEMSKSEKISRIEDIIEAMEDN